MRSLTSQNKLLSKLRSRAARPACMPLYSPPSHVACAVRSYIKTCLGGPTPAEYEALLAERELLKKELSAARQQIEELQQVCQHGRKRAGHS